MPRLITNAARSPMRPQNQSMSTIPSVTAA